jgi:hypothetical protein
MMYLRDKKRDNRKYIYYSTSGLTVRAVSTCVFFGLFTTGMCFLQDNVSRLIFAGAISASISLRLIVALALKDKPKKDSIKSIIIENGSKNFTTSLITIPLAAMRSDILANIMPGPLTKTHFFIGFTTINLLGRLAFNLKELVLNFEAFEDSKEGKRKLREALLSCKSSMLSALIFRPSLNAIFMFSSVSNITGMKWRMASFAIIVPIIAVSYILEGVMTEAFKGLVFGRENVNFKSFKGYANSLSSVAIAVALEHTGDTVRESLLADIVSSEAWDRIQATLLYTFVGGAIRTAYMTVIDNTKTLAAVQSKGIA